VVIDEPVARNAAPVLPCRTPATFFASRRELAIHLGMVTRSRSIFVNRPLIAVAALAAVAVAVPALHAKAAAGETAISCTNPASGATWEIVVNYDGATVDSNPASISDATISWHDAKDMGNYTLDRKSGALTVVVASSTGGYFLHDQCRLGNPG
jgi:hypothetical protein